jgi:hypothetical protein
MMTAMADEIPARFRKTKNDTWAVMAPVDVLEKALAEGGKVDVQKKSGDWTTFQVGSLGRPFDVDGVQMCYGYPPSDDADDEADPAAGSAKRGAPAPRAASGQGRQAPRRSSRPAKDWGAAPAPDPSEPLPEFQGGPEDEWDGGF